jgi:hypothetical protein
MSGFCFGTMTLLPIFLIIARLATGVVRLSGRVLGDVSVLCCQLSAMAGAWWSDSDWQERIYLSRCVQFYFSMFISLVLLCGNARIGRLQLPKVCCCWLCL